MTTTQQLTLGLVAIICVAGLGAVAGLSPSGWARLRDIGLWATVLGAFLPPLLYVLATYRSSENAAMWLALGVMVSLGAAAVGYLIGLFLPPSWPLWMNVGLGLIFWAIAAAFALR